MDNYMDQLLKMRPLECEYREFYEKSDRDFYTHPAELDVFQEYLYKKYSKKLATENKDISSTLDEEAFFAERQDIAVFQHYRYMPGIWHEHDFFELACVVSGEFRHYLQEAEDDHMQTLQAGDILILSPHTRHTVTAFRQEDLLINILIRSSTFENTFFDTLPEDDLIRRFFHDALYHSSFQPYLLFRTGQDPELSSLILELRQEFLRNRRFQNTCLRADLSLLFVKLLRNHEQDVIIPDANQNVMSEQDIYILQYMQKNYTTITLSHLAAFFNYSERQMQRIITNITGCSFSENIRALRMKKAASLLKDTELPVAKIAEVLGYCDTSNFRQIFKSHFGRTPQEFRSAAGELKI